MSKSKCEPDGMVYTSNPPQYRCVNCRRWWFCKDETPDCSCGKPCEVEEHLHHCYCGVVLKSGEIAAHNCLHAAPKKEELYKRTCSHGDELHWQDCAECREYMVRNEAAPKKKPSERLHDTTTCTTCGMKYCGCCADDRCPHCGCDSDFE